MIEWLKTKMIWILGILLILSIAGNVLLITKGINITRTTYITTHSRSDSVANSASLAIGYIGGDARGEWKNEMKIFDFSAISSREADMTALNNFYNTLDPIQYTLKETICPGQGTVCAVFYPVITPYKSERHEGKVTTKKEKK